MRCQVILCTTDFRRFIKNNTLKLIICSIIVSLTAILAIRNAFLIEDICEYFEKSSSAIISYLLGEWSAFGVLGVAIIVNAALTLVIVVCSYSDFTAFIAFVILPVKVYSSVFTDIVILRYFGFLSIVYLVLHLVVIAAQAFVFWIMCCINYNNTCRYKYCFSEIVCAVKSLLLPMIALLALCVVEVIFVILGGLFI